MADPIAVFNSPPPLNPADFETTQEKAKLDRTIPYPTGSPLSPEDEAKRAIGDLWKEPVT